MTIDSTQQTLHYDTKKSNMKTPRKSSINFIRQFARSYAYLPDLATGMMAN